MSGCTSREYNLFQVEDENLLLNEIPKNKEMVKDFKILISAGYGAGEGFPHQIINKPFIVEPNSCCTETYIVIGPFSTKKRCENVVLYMKTKFFRFMVMMVKNSPLLN